MVAAAVVGAAVIGGVASNQAANTQAAAAKDAAGMQAWQAQQARNDSAPWRNAGGGAVGYLAYLEGVPGYENFGQSGNTGPQQWVPDPLLGSLGAGKWQANPSNGMGAPGAEFGSLGRGFTMADFQADPGYQFRMDQAMKALQGSAAARGSLMSGGALRDLDSYSQGLASQEYQNAFNRFETTQNDRYNRLASLAGLGQTANASNSQLGMMAANNQGNYLTQGANASAAGYMGMANAATQGMGNWMQYQMYNNMNTPYFQEPSLASLPDGRSMPPIDTSTPQVVG